MKSTKALIDATYSKVTVLVLLRIVLHPQKPARALTLFTQVHTIWDI